MGRCAKRITVSEVLSIQISISNLFIYGSWSEVVKVTYQNALKGALIAQISKSHAVSHQINLFWRFLNLYV